LAAIDTLDQAVVASGGEVITAAERRAAIRELDKAVEATEQTFPRLSKAIAEAQRVRAWDADEDFAAALAAGAITIDTSAGEGRFAAWAEHRYEWKKSRAAQMAAAGRVLALTTSTTTVVEPSSERQIRPLTRLLGRHEDSIPKVWEQAVAEAEADHKPQSVARYVDAIIRDQWPELFSKSAEDSIVDLDKKVRRFRKLFAELLAEMNHQDFDDRILEWLDREAENR
jgi:hypothetical protein